MPRARVSSVLNGMAFYEFGNAISMNFKSDHDEGLIGFLGRKTEAQRSAT